MSSSVSGKFQDHYIVLGVDPAADPEAIQAAYTKLSKKYHPDNPETGDDKNFEAVKAAYEVLSDPALRLEFDKVKGVDRESHNPKFAGAVFFEGLKRAALLRSAILCILCDQRRTRLFNPTISLRHLETMLHTTKEELNFVMWYLKQRGYVTNDDKSNLEITVEGLDYLERDPPSAEAVLPLIKSDALAAAAQKPRADGTEALSVLQRALRRERPPQEVRAIAPRSKS